ncbi:MAG: nucleotide sugar dehydrogenase [Flavobacteriaceae bacterium]
MKTEEKTIGIIGLGYVGLPLAVAFAKHFQVGGFDINAKRVAALQAFQDDTLEIESDALREVVGKSLIVTTEIADLKSCTYYIITVPTPVTENKIPDLTPLQKSSQTVGSILKKGDTVIYESTVYPGATEEVCLPILEQESGLNYNQDFYLGYSPERINPGDKEHTVTKILKIVSGSTPAVLEDVAALYGTVIEAGIYKASNIKTAEAAKVIENTQRDINIAFVNELALIFDRLGLDTNEVLEAAGTKWNFLKFQPGLVGGHCIGVDPYYLAYKAQEVGFNPEMILAGRRVNDNMGHFIAGKLVKMMSRKNLPIAGGEVLILGVTFKENCPDIRNSMVPTIAYELLEYGMKVLVYDPHADTQEVEEEYGIVPIQTIASYDAVVLAVAHTEFKSLDLAALKKTPDSVVFDIKGMFDKAQVDNRL